MRSNAIGAQSIEATLWWQARAVLSVSLMKVCVYAIALDEAKHVEAFMATASEADLVVVADTGSRDGTVDALTAAGAVVHRISIRPWRFDDARNAALALVPADVDVCVSVDLDEVLAPGWRSLLDAEWEGATAGTCHYVWSHDADGRPGLTFRADRVHQRHGYRWVNPCHEVVVADRVIERKRPLSFVLDHWPDPSKPRSTYLDLLEVGFAERPHDPRSVHYLGREYMFVGRYSDAVRLLTTHVTMPESTWADERSASLRFMGRCLLALQREREAQAAIREATEVAPWSREAWSEYAGIAYGQELWQVCYEAAKRALDITDPSTSVFLEPEAWGERVHDIGSIAAWHLGHWDESLTLAEEAAVLAPHIERLRSNVAWIRARIEDVR